MQGGRRTSGMRPLGVGQTVHMQPEVLTTIRVSTSIRSIPAAVAGIRTQRIVPLHCRRAGAGQPARGSTWSTSSTLLCPQQSDMRRAKRRTARVHLRCCGAPCLQLQLLRLQLEGLARGGGEAGVQGWLAVQSLHSGMPTVACSAEGMKQQHWCRECAVHEDKTLLAVPPLASGHLAGQVPHAGDVAGHAVALEDGGVGGEACSGRAQQAGRAGRQKRTPLKPAQVPLQPPPSALHSPCSVAAHRKTAPPRPTWSTPARAVG